MGVYPRSEIQYFSIAKMPPELRPGRRRKLKRILAGSTVWRGLLTDEYCNRVRLDACEFQEEFSAMKHPGSTEP
jgi:hypothetical protein